MAPQKRNSLLWHTPLSAGVLFMTRLHGWTVYEPIYLDILIDSGQTTGVLSLFRTPNIPHRQLNIL